MVPDLTLENACEQLGRKEALLQNTHEELLKAIAVLWQLKNGGITLDQLQVDRDTMTWKITTVPPAQKQPAFHLLEDDLQLTRAS